MPHRRFAAIAAIGFALAFVALGIIATAAPGDSPHHHPPVVRRPPAVVAPLDAGYGFAAWHEIGAAAADYVGALKVAEAVDLLVHQAADYAAWSAEQERLAAEEYARAEAERVAASARAAAARPASVTPPSASAQGGGGGPLTAAQLQALAQCESGGQNGWRTGYFGLEDGTGTVGQRSWDSQVAQVQQIYARYGRSAWGCADQAGLP